MDRKQYNPACFKRHKSAQSNGLRLSFEVRNFLYITDTNSKKRQKADRSLHKYILRVENILKGSHALSKSVQSGSDIAEALAKDGFALVVVSSISKFDFETGKVLLNLISRLLFVSNPMQNAVLANIDQFFVVLTTRYEQISLCLSCGIFLRDLLGYPYISKALLSIDTIDKLMEIIMREQFEVSSDVFDTLKEFLSADEKHVYRFLKRNRSYVLEIIDTMSKQNFYYLRKSLTLLYSLIVKPKNHTLAREYAFAEKNVRDMMILMRDNDSQPVKTEAFYLFAVILHKLDEGLPDSEQLPAFHIVRKNKKNLIHFFEKFQVKLEDQDFQNDRLKVLELINKI